MLKTTFGGDRFSSCTTLFLPPLSQPLVGLLYQRQSTKRTVLQLLCDQIVFTIHLKFFINVVSQQKTNVALRPAALV